MSLEFDLDKIYKLDPKSIIIERDKRQRKIFTTDDLKDSMSRRGQMTPIIVEERIDGQTYLIAGERRLTTFLENPKLGLIKATYLADVGPVLRQILELEENIRRQSLSWTEEIDALLTIHELYCSEQSGWTVKQTAEGLGFAYITVYRQLEVAKEIRKGNPRLEGATGWSTAWSHLETQRERKKEHSQALLDAEITSSFKAPESETYTVADVKVIQREATALEDETPVPVPQKPNGPDVPLINGDALKFFEDYQGVPFNFGHFDFPYGINYQDMDQANTETHGDYEDTPEIYFELLNGMLKNRNSLFSESFHGMFWFSPKMWDETFEFFRKNAPEIWIQDIPLVWHKTDNRGILSDPHRRPRNITEFALILVRGDRKIIKPVSNCYGAPTSKTIHGSEKPVPVLKYFYQMFLDGTSRVLDPTAGSANSLVAALDFHPASMLGLEKSPEFHALASANLKKQMILKNLEKKNG